MDILHEEVTINGVNYVRADTIKQLQLSGKRAILVLDRGWIVAGDLTDENGRIKVTRAVHVRSWTNIGFDGMVANPRSTNVILKPIPNGFDVPHDSELFRIPVPDDWGL